MEYRLLEKTELWINPVRLVEADLEACARAAARALELNPNEIMVTDAMEDRLTFDVLVPTIRAEQIVARKRALLDALGKVPGVIINDKTEVHSDGILGLISLDEKTREDVLERTRAIGAKLADRIRKRALVFSTGKEVLAGQIRDTNAPYLVRALREIGYDAGKGPTLEDQANTIARAFRFAAQEGYGLLISTGGIGAEGKDQTLEALQGIDPGASLPYILKFKKGRGRHHKDGVRIGVGHLGDTLIVSLPGPHDEVCLAWPVLEKGLKLGWDKDVLAENLADVLRNKFMARSGARHIPSEHMIEEVTHGTK
jgi:molybdenum cofactor synthesis domain-containing protein